MAEGGGGSPKGDETGRALGNN